jgi:hypothetical protein
MGVGGGGHGGEGGGGGGMLPQIHSTFSLPPPLHLELNASSPLER